MGRLPDGRSFPSVDGPHDDDVVLDRRDFLRLAGASLAIAGLDGQYLKSI